MVRAVELWSGDPKFYLHPNDYSVHVPRIVLNGFQFNSSVMLLIANWFASNQVGFLQWLCYKPMSPSSKKQGVLNWKCLGLYVTRQLIWSTDTKICYYSLLKKEITWTGYSTKKNLQINWSFFASYGTLAMNYFVSLGILCIRDAGHRGKKITDS